MASLTKRRKSPNWVACYSLPDGTRLQRSTGTKDKATAMKIALSCEAAAKRKVTADRAREMISEIVEMIHGDAVSNVSCAEYFRSWKERRRTEVKAPTLDRYDDVTKSLSAFLGKAWEAPVAELAQAQIADWRDELARRYSPVSVNIYLKVVKQALKDAWCDGKIVASSAEKVKLLKIKNEGSSKKAFTPDQYNRILAASKDEWEGMIIAGLFSGQRLSDIAWMEVDHIKNGWWRFKTRKTGMQMAIPLSAQFLDWLGKWLKVRKIASKYVFPIAQERVDSGKGRSGKLSGQFYRIMAEAGIVPPRNNNISKGIGRSGKRAVSELSFHSFRHTCTTWLKAQGVSESVAMAFVGHESESINRNYTHMPESTLLEAMREMEKFSVVKVA